MSQIKGVWIEAAIWNLEGFSIMEKLFLQKIKELDNEFGCIASNAFFSEFYGVSKSRCTQIIKSLESKGAISIILKKEGKTITKRVLNILNTLFNKLNTPIENIKHPYLENCEYNSKELNNKLINSIREKDKEIEQLKKRIEFLEREEEDGKKKKLANAHKHLDAIVELCTYFKEVTGKRIIIGSTPSQIVNSTKGKAIAARLNEKATVEQIKQIIDHKNKTWQGEQRVHLCFETLLRPKHFTKYLEAAINDEGSQEQISQPKTLTDHFRKYYEPSKFSKLERKSKLVEYEQQFKQQQFKLVNISKSYSNESITPALIFEFTTLPLGRNLVGSTVDKKLSSFKNWFSKLSDFQQNKGDIREQLELFNKRNDRN